MSKRCSVILGYPYDYLPQKNLNIFFLYAVECRNPVLYTQLHLIMGGIETGFPVRLSRLFYNQVVFHLNYTFNATGNFSCPFGAFVRVNKTAQLNYPFECLDIDL